MGLYATLLIPREEKDANASEFEIRDQINFDQNYIFFSQFVDISTSYAEGKMPKIKLEELTVKNMVRNINGEPVIPEPKEYYIGRAGQFSKIDVSDTSPKNKAIITFLNELDPMRIVIVKLS